MTDDHSRSGPLRLGGIEFWDRSEGGGGSAAAGRGGNGPEDGNSDVHNGTVVSGEEKAKSDHAGESEPKVVDRSHVPPGVLEHMRTQVADFADFAHRSRIAPNSADPLHALGCGGGLTATVVDHMAAELFDKADLYGKEAVDQLGADQQTLNDSLLLALVAPGEPDKLTERQLELFASWRGRLAIDVSTFPVGSKPVTTVHRLTTGYAAVIVGSAAFIAGDRPYLSLDALMSYARSEIYRSGGPVGQPRTQSTGLHAARNLEIVLLLDNCLECGLWIDIDRLNGRLAAALAIELSPKTGVTFTHLPKLRVPKLRTLPASVATA